jgi:DNA-directed RNA polymerase subunit F
MTRKVESSSPPFVQDDQGKPMNDLPKISGSPSARKMGDQLNKLSKSKLYVELAEQVRKVSEPAQMRELGEQLKTTGERLRQLRAKVADVSPPTPSRKETTKVGRKSKQTKTQIAEGIRLLDSLPKMTIDAACATLREAGIEGSRSRLNENIIKPAYASRR